ncbi:MAG: HAD family hydrolase [Lachnospiraceae bacterium]|uniref:HAD family hydrolase n=1 Tax=Candidatus Weimeria bifida TaxID=2599074 RepID=A0A6N7J1B8_9FIRM|nr:HAD family hydrolase [Candidatus Weimeria bifida]RRF96421.1 MAG: HAD family hydrolase [Lachnospiraceae bacterium]
MRYKNIFFDLDGTITDSGNAIMTCAKYALDRMGFPDEPEERLRRFVGPSLMDSFVKLYGMTEERAAEATRIFRSLYVDNKMYDVTVYPGIPELLAKCREAGLKTFVVTSKVQEYAGRIIKKTGLADLFTDTIGPDPTDFSSDKSRLINRVVDDYSLDKAECVMIGDTRFDIEGAVKAGVDSIAVTYGYGNPAEMQMVHPTYKAADAAEIGDIILP